MNLRDTLGASHVIASPSGSVSVNGFQHLALTYDQTSGLCVLYTNGIPVASRNMGSFTPQTTYPFNLGKRTAAITGQGTTFNGVLDEVSLYSRALAAEEIQMHYEAGRPYAE